MNGGGATDGDSIRTTVRNLQLGMHSQFYEVVHPLVVEALADDASLAEWIGIAIEHNRAVTGIRR